MTLYELARRGDPDALALLVRKNIPLVQALCRRFPGNEDAFQQGCLGLVKAIRGFREERGCAFSTYAVPVILGDMRRSREKRFGWRTQATLNRVRAYQADCLRQIGREPSVSDAARRVGLEPAELALLLERDQPAQYDETGALLPSLPDPDGEGWLIRFFIRDILDRLPPDETYLLRQRFLWGRSQTQVARGLGVPQYRLSRREKQARLHFRQEWEAET